MGGWKSPNLSARYAEKRLDEPHAILGDDQVQLLDAAEEMFILEADAPGFFAEPPMVIAVATDTGLHAEGLTVRCKRPFGPDLCVLRQIHVILWQGLLDQRQFRMV